MDRRTALGALGCLGGVGLAGCLGGDGDGGDGTTPEGGSQATEDESTPTSAFDRPPSITAAAFDDGEPIPTRFSCDGENVSPELAIDDVPDGTARLALVLDDPDAPGGTYTHWLLWNVPATTETIPEGVPPGETVEGLDGASQGTNDAGVVGYSGPCPPRAHDPHTYRFRLLALAAPLDVAPGGDRPAFDSALEQVEHAESVLRGTYDR